MLFIRENYPSCTIRFIVHNIDTYITSVLTADNFELNEMLILIEEKIADKYKIEMLKFTNSQISIKEKHYTKAVREYILNHNMAINDLPYLLTAYSSEQKDIQPIIRNLFLRYRQNIIDNHYDIDICLFFELIDSASITGSDKQNLFIITLPNMNENQCKAALEKLKYAKLLSLFKRKRPLFEMTESNEKILDIFKQKGWITNYEQDKKNPEYYRAYSRRKKNTNELPIEQL